MKKAFIFDFDGTLSETFPLILESVDIAYRRLGLVPPTKEVLFANFGPSERGMIKRITPDRADELFSQYLKASEEIIAERGLKAFDGIEEVLAALKSAGVKIALITGKSEESLRLTLAAIGLGKYFDLLKWGDESGSVKPRRLREVLSDFALMPEDAVYIGDSVQDIKDCREVGVPILSAAWADCADVSALEAQSPDAVLRSPKEILAYL